MLAVTYSPTRKASIVTHWRPANPSDEPSRAPRRAKASDALAQFVRPWLFWMRARTGFTANLATLDGGELMYTAWMPSRLVGQVEQAAARQPGWSASAHSRAAGLALLAYTAEGDWPERTRGWACRDPKRHARLLGELEEVCERRYAVRRDAAGVGVAAAVLGVSEAVAAVELSVFGEHARGAGLRGLAGVVVEAAGGIAEQLEDDSGTVA